MWPWNCIRPDVFGNESWFTKFERYGMGGFSMAAHQANTEMEDYSQVEVGDKSLLVGIYDGRGGNKAAKLLSTVLLQKLLRQIHENNDVMSYDLLREAITATKKLFVGEQDSSCLISLVWKGTLYIANVGDSRLVIGTEVGDTSVLKVEQLTNDQSSKLKIHSRIIRDDDRCLILASSGFWKIMKNEEAMLIVERHSRHDIAKRLLEKALEKVAAKDNLAFNQLVGLAVGERKTHHDDITVIVVFMSQGKKSRKNIPKLSYRIPPSKLGPLKSMLGMKASELGVDRKGGSIRIEEPSGSTVPEEEPLVRKGKPLERGVDRKGGSIRIVEPLAPPRSSTVPEEDIVGRGKGTVTVVPVKKQNKNSSSSSSSSLDNTKPLR